MGSALRTALLLGALTGLLVGLGYILGGPGMALIALVFAGVMNFFAYWFSDKLALRMGGASEVTQAEQPALHAMVGEVATLAGVPKPRVYLIQNESPNAFATGRNPHHAAVAVTSGIMRILTDRELRGVIAHEMAHVKNRDILTASIAATMAGAISYIQTMLFFSAIFGGGRGRDNIYGALLAAIVAGVAAVLLQMAISRTREFAADKTGAGFINDPISLANALAKLHNGIQMRPLEKKAGSEATASLYIVNPFRMQGGISSLFATHPPVEERIKRLRAIAGYADVA